MPRRQLCHRNGFGRRQHASSNGAYSSIALDSIGNPIISSYDNMNFDLVITRCVEPFCNPRRIRSINA